MPPVAAPAAAPIAAPLPPPKMAPIAAPVAAPAPVPTAVLVPCCVWQPASRAPITAKTDRRVNNFVFIFDLLESTSGSAQAPTVLKGLRTSPRTSLYNGEKGGPLPDAMRPRKTLQRDSAARASR